MTLKDQIEYRLRNLKDANRVYEEYEYDSRHWLAVDTRARIDELESLLECINESNNRRDTD